MQYALSILALAAAVLASPAPQGVTSAIAPEGSPPSICQSSYDGTFQVTVIKPAEGAPSKRGLEKRQSTDGILTLTLKDGILKDALDRTGYIADNYQFQFDKPPQTGALVTAGFSACANSSSLTTLGLGGTTVFYQCLSGDFYNLYDRSWAAQCSPVHIQFLPLSGGGGSGSGGSASPGATITTGGGASSGAPPATVLPDGQPQASSAAPASPPLVTVIADGQPQAQSAIPMRQLTDGQPNMPTGLVKQLGDGQPQVTTSAAAVGQIPDGQPQAGNATVLATPTPTILIGAGAAPTVVAEMLALAAGAAAVALL